MLTAGTALSAMQRAEIQGAKLFARDYVRRARLQRHNARRHAQMLAAAADMRRAAMQWGRAGR